MRKLTHPTPLRDLDLQATVVARPPLFRSIERPNGQGVREPLRSEDEVYLAGRRARSLAIRVVGRHVLTVPGQLIGPRISSSSVGRVRPHEGEPNAFILVNTVS